MLRIIIAEDDQAMRLILKKTLAKMPGVNVVGEASNGKELIQMVETLEPNVVILDVEMPEMNGVDASKEIFDINPNIFIIFATAFDNYTHEAFQVYAFDYILKPFKLERLKNTINRIIDLKAIREAKSVFKGPEISAKNQDLKLMVQSNEKFNVINVYDILLITRHERKTRIFTRKEVVDTYEPLKDLEERLDDRVFFRSHKGYIVNVNAVTEMQPWGDRTYLIKFANLKETALITFDKVKKFKEKYCIL